MLLPAVLILLVWLLAFVLCVGIGLAAWRLAAPIPLEPEALLLAFWPGWAVLLAVLQIWHLWAPVGWATVMLWMALGLGGLVWQRAAWLSCLRRLPSSAWGYLAVLLLVGLWLGNRALGPITSGDMGLYHLPSIRWNTTYAIVPGLGNLHSRLAFNSAHFLYVALFEISPWVGKSYHFATGLLFLAFTALAGGCLARWLVQRQPLEAYQLLTLGMAIYLPTHYFNETSNISNDLPVFWLEAVLAILLSQLFFSQISPLQVRNRVFTILLLVATGVTIKLSFAPLGVIAGLVTLLRLGYLRRQGGEAWLQRGDLAWLFALLILLIWMGRGLILSGYPAYPSTLGGVGLPWQIPPEQAKRMVTIIASWARHPWVPVEQAPNDWSWLWRKLSKSGQRIPEFVLPLGLFLLGGGMWLKRWLKNRWLVGQWDASILWVGLFLSPAVIFLIYWFFSAPNTRFLGASFWWLGMGSLTSALHRIPRPGRWVATASLLWLILFGVYAYTFSPWITASPESGFIAAPQPPTRAFVTASGLVLQVPLEMEACWDAPLPCTPYPTSQLALRRPGDLSGGFVFIP